MKSMRPYLPRSRSALLLTTSQVALAALVAIVLVNTAWGHHSDPGLPAPDHIPMPSQPQAPGY